MQHPANRFELTYAGQRLRCRTVMYDTWYRIYFDGQLIAEIAMNGDMEWMLTGGSILPHETVRYIGRKIESRYN